MYPSQLQERALAPVGGLGSFLDAVPDLELWLRGRTVAFHGEISAEQLDAIRSSCEGLWPVEDAFVEADLVISAAALSTSLLDLLARHVRVGGAVVMLDACTLSISASRFEALVAPTALEIVRYSLPYALPFLSRWRRPVSCILRRRN